MKCKLTPQLSSDDWKDFCSRFHFSPADLPYIKSDLYRTSPTGGILCVLLPRSESGWDFPPSLCLWICDTWKWYRWAVRIISESWTDPGSLYRGLRQSLLLSKAYAEFAHVIEDQSGLSLAELSFLGDTYSLDLLPQIYERLAPDAIGLTEGRCFCPSKQLRLSCIWIQIHTQTSDNYVIPAQPVRIFPVLPENLLSKTCRIPMALCRYSI